MKPYVHGQTPAAQLRKATTRVNFLEHQLARIRNQKPKRPDQWPAFDSPAFRAEYERERDWAARRWPEPPEVKQARLELLTTEIYRPARRLSA